MMNHWFITRPKRRLVLLVDVLKAFMAVLLGNFCLGGETYVEGISR